ncbi:MAG: AgmX/PglI C-terminal domain-containing protein [Myxococcota bacterium]
MHPLYWRIVLPASLLAVGACSRSVEGETKAAADAPAAAQTGQRPKANSESAPQPAPDPKPIAARPSGYAVVRVGAQVFGSSTGPELFRLPPLGDEPTEPAGVTVRVVGEKNGRLEVETLVERPPEHHCAGTLPGLALFRLRLYVSRDHLLPVTIEESSYDFADGTKLRLGRGVPVPSNAKGSLVAAGTPIEVTVPGISLGLFYEPTEPFSEQTRKGARPRTKKKGYWLSYDDGHILAEGALYAADGATGRTGTSPKLFGTVDKGGASLFTVRNACLEVTALAVRQVGSSAIPQMARNFDPEMTKMHAHILSAAGREGGNLLSSSSGVSNTNPPGGAGLGTLETRGTYSVKAGTPILWANGTPAGQVTAAHTFEATHRAQEDRRCLDISLTDALMPTVTLCFADGDAIETTRPSSTGAGRGKTISSGSTSPSSRRGTRNDRRSRRVPQVRQAKATVRGALDRDIIRRIVRSHINEVRYCYRQGLAKDPTLAGRVTIELTIDPSGKVPTANVKSTSLSDDEVAECIAKATKRWRFPKPSDGGVAIVTYPFVLDPA